VGQELRADAGLVAASVAIYMLTVGIGSLFWGPMVRVLTRELQVYKKCCSVCRCIALMSASQ
jgi:hypothetical protein